jgi:hypothetical protein
LARPPERLQAAHRWWYFLRVGGDRIDECCAYLNQLIAALLDLFIQVRFVLESVDIQIAVIQRFIGQNEIVKGDDFVKLYFRHLLRHRPYLLIDPRADTHFDMIRVLSGGATGGKQRGAGDKQRNSKLLQRKNIIPESFLK